MTLRITEVPDLKGGTRLLLGNLELTSITGVTGLRLVLSKGHNKVGVYLPPLEDGNRSCFRNVVF
jgi:hypothetical protein